MGKSPAEPVLYRLPLEQVIRLASYIGLIIVLATALPLSGNHHVWLLTASVVIALFVSFPRLQRGWPAAASIAAGALLLTVALYLNPYAGAIIRVPYYILWVHAAALFSWPRALASAGLLYGAFLLGCDCAPFVGELHFFVALGEAFNFIGGAALIKLLVDLQQRLRGLNECLTESEQRYRSLFDWNPNAVFAADLNGHLLHTNPAGERLSGYPSAAIAGRPLTALTPPDQRAEILAEFRLASQGGPRDHETAFLSRDGLRVDVHLTHVPIIVDGQTIGLFGVASDITQRKRFEAQLAQQALHDPVTGLPNRLLFMDRLRQALARNQRAGTLSAVLFLDLDDFKRVNDRFGHDAGDQLLRAVADRLRAPLRPADTVARLGGDEFTILLHETPSARAASRVAARILAAFASPFPVAHQQQRISASIGVALSDADSTPDRLLRQADAAMYQAKRTGKAAYVVFHPDLSPTTEKT